MELPEYYSLIFINERLNKTDLTYFLSLRGLALGFYKTAPLNMIVAARALTSLHLSPASLLSA